MMRKYQVRFGGGRRKRGRKATAPTAHPTCRRLRCRVRRLFYRADRSNPALVAGFCCAFLFRPIPGVGRNFNTFFTHLDGCDT